MKNDSAELIHRLYFPSSKRPCQSSRPWERKPDVSGVKCLLFPQKKKKKGKKNECKSPIIGWKKRRIRRTNVHLTFDLTNDSFRRRFNYLLLYLLIASSVNSSGAYLPTISPNVKCTRRGAESHSLIGRLLSKVAFHDSMKNCDYTLAYLLPMLTLLSKHLCNNSLVSPQFPRYIPGAFKLEDQWQEFQRDDGP